MDDKKAPVKTPVAEEPPKVPPPPPPTTRNFHGGAGPKLPGRSVKLYELNECGELRRVLEKGDEAELQAWIFRKGFEQYNAQDEGFNSESE